MTTPDTLAAPVTAAPAMVPLTDAEWLEYLLKHADLPTLDLAAFRGESIQSRGLWVLRVQANDLRKLVERAHGIGLTVAASQQPTGDFDPLVEIARLVRTNDQLRERIAGLIQQAAQATTGAPSEPFGYFKAQPFGWTDCAEDDDGAVALYERPQQAEQAQSVRLEAAERLAADRLEQMNADRKQAIVWRDQAELYEQVRKFSPREFQALWTKNVTSGAMFDDLVRAAIASEAKT